jgi:hypothetical protein
VSSYITGSVNGILADYSVIPPQSIMAVQDVFRAQDLAQAIALLGKPACVLNDHLTYNLDFDTVPAYYTLLWLEQQIDAFQQDIAPTTETYPTHYCFSFSLNKKQINRFFLIKLVEYFKFISYEYTWSGHGREFDLALALDQIYAFDQDQNFQQFIYSPITMAEKWIKFSENNHNETDAQPGSGLYHGGNSWTWLHGLDQLYSHGAVNLIGESIEYDRTCCFTEKTLYAMLGLCFPIWVGGYGQAQAFESLGLDSFSDIINHDYQWAPTLIERCYQAVALNRRILEDLEYARACRERCWDRLIQNRQWIYTEKLVDHNNHLIARWPDYVLDQLPRIIYWHDRPGRMARIQALRIQVD